jgi:uncharacterized membrane protein (DUF485 family)
MEDKEKKTEEVEAAPDKEEAKPAEAESDFSDEEKEPEPAKKETPKKEKKAEPEVDLYKEGAEQATPEEISQSAKGAAGKATYEYKDNSLAEIEASRATFYAYYKKQNIIKIVITVAALVVMILGYVLPMLYWKDEEGNTTSYATYLALGIIAVCLVGLGIYSWLSKRASDKKSKAYIAKYYEGTDTYLFDGFGASDVQGGYQSQIKKEDFIECGLYKDVTKIACRNALTFEYEGMRCRLVDAAAQSQGASRQMTTLFVGKYLTVTNTHKGNDVIIYLKGNKRATPPNNLAGYDILENKPDYIIYGTKSNKSPIPNKTRSALSEVRTNKTLIDLAIAIKEGKTYFLMGYEDTLMAIPSERHFNPAPMEEYKDDLKKCLAIAATLNRDAETGE